MRAEQVLIAVTATLNSSHARLARYRSILCHVNQSVEYLAPRTQRGRKVTSSLPLLPPGSKRTLRSTQHCAGGRSIGAPLHHSHERVDA